MLGREDSNLRMPPPKGGTLPLGDAPIVNMKHGVYKDQYEKRLFLANFIFHTSYFIFQNDVVSVARTSATPSSDATTDSNIRKF